MKEYSKLKKIITSIGSILIIIMVIISVSNIYAIASEGSNEEEFEFKKIDEVKHAIEQSMIDNNDKNKKMFILTTEDNFERVSDEIFECINSQENSKLKKGYNSLEKTYKSILESENPQVSFYKPNSDYNRDDKDNTNQSKKRYTVVFKNEIPDVLFLYKINKSWSQQENDEFSIKADKYKNWIKKQVLAVCDEDEEIGDFGGWTYGSYLNLAEVAYGVSLTYNWMYDDLTDQERESIEKSIIKYSIEVFNEKGYNDYFTAEHSSINTNRNQVINSSIGLNALILLNCDYELENKLDEEENIIDNIFFIKDKNGNYIKQNEENIEINLKESILNDMIDEDNLVTDFNDFLYAIIGKTINLQARFFIDRLEGGGYPEGIGYYRYGMSFTNYYLSSLYNLLETDFGIMNIKGLYDSLLYPVYLESNSDKIFNYGDVSEESSKITSVSNTRMIWMANYYISKGEEEKLENAYLLYNLEGKYNWGMYNMIWYNDDYANEAEEHNVNYGRDYLFKNISVASINKSFEEQSNDIYIGTKAGRVQRSHGDLDLGSFVLDALGERWIEDFGSESYTAATMNNTRYGRWNYYKKRAEGHSTLVINPVTAESYSDEFNFYFLGADQYIYAETSIKEFVNNDESSYITMDLSDAYNRYNKNKQTENPSYVVKVERTIGVYENRNIAKLTDVLRLDKERNIYSFLNVSNDVSSIDIAEDGKSAVLTKENGKKLKIELNSSKPAVLKTMKKKPLSDFLNGINDYGEGYEFNENLTDIDKEKLYVNVYAKNAIIEIKFLPVYIDQVEISYDDVIQDNTHYVDVTIEANDKMKEIDGWILSEDKKTLTKRYAANTKEEIKIYDMAGNETVKTIEINNIDHGGINGIEIKNAKTKYIEGQSFDNSELEVEVKYNDGTSQIINSRNLNLKVLDGENLVAGKESVTISYAENDESIIIEQEIEVLKLYSIYYELNGGVNNEENPSTYTVEDEIELKQAEKQGYEFGGWYENADFTGEKVTKIKNRTGNVTLYAKWLKRGDIDKDGKTNITDLLLLKRHIISGTRENWKLTGDKLNSADLNNDGKINITDLLLLKRIILNSN